MIFKDLYLSFEVVTSDTFLIISEDKIMLGRFMKLYFPFYMCNYLLITIDMMSNCISYVLIICNTPRCKVFPFLILSFLLFQPKYHVIVSQSNLKFEFYCITEGSDVK